MMAPLVSFIVIGRNQGRVLPFTLLALDKYLEQVDFNYEIVSVNDGSTDTTFLALSQLAQIVKKIRVITNAEYLGLARSARIGLLGAKGIWKVFLSAGLGGGVALPVEAILNRIKKDDNHIIFATAPRSFKEQKFLEWISYSITRFLTKILLRLKFEPFEGLVIAFKERAAQDIFSKLKFNSSFSFYEALILASRLHYPLHYIEEKFRVAREKTSWDINYLQIFREAVRMRWWISKDVYGLQAVSPFAYRLSSEVSKSGIEPLFEADLKVKKKRPISKIKKRRSRP